MTEALHRFWKSPGPVASAFMNSAARTAAIMGPIGSGKTRTVFTKLIRLAAAQRPSPLDGIRYFKCCVVRDTYRKLWDTTIPSWFKLMPKDTGDWSGGFGDPAQATMYFNLPDGTRAVLILDFIAIGDQRAEEAMRGYEPTAFYLNEADLMEEDVYTHARSRAGRFPDMAHGGPSWWGILMDFNAPDVENWVYHRIVEARDRDGNPVSPDDVSFFRQPSARDSRAENIANLPEDYYAEQERNQPAWWVRRFILNEFGFARDGKPIYPEFSDAIHVAPQRLLPVPGMPLIFGFDAGLSPAAVVTQHLPSGQWRVYEEIVGEQGTGATRFGERIGQIMRERYHEWRFVTAWADPSASYGADKDAGEQTWIEIVSARSGLNIWPAPTNAPIARWEAVRRPLMRFVDSGTPGFLLSPNCTLLRKGFNSTYRFRQLRIPGRPRFDESAEKNEYSHPHDALQYALSGGGEDADLGDRKRWADEALAMPREAPYYDPFSKLFS